MIIWLASYPRSGNTFLRVVLNRVFGIKTYSIYDDESDIGADKKLSDVVGHEFLPAGFNLQQARSSEQNYFIKTHDSPEHIADDKVIYLLRDGRESTLSYRRYLMDYHAQSISLRDVIRGRVMFGAWGQHVSTWNPEERSNTLLLRFEELITDPNAAAELIAEYTGLKPVCGTVPSFQELHEKGPKFFRSGQKNSWKKEYSQADHYAFWLQNYEQMMRFGYRDDIPEMFSRTPELGYLLQLMHSEYVSLAAQVQTQLTAVDENIARLRTEQAKSIETITAVFSEKVERLFDTGAAQICVSRTSSQGKQAGDTDDGEDDEARRISVVANEQGEQCFKQGKLDEAEEKFLKAIRNDPGFTDGYNNLGVLWWKKGDAAKALDFFATGIRLDPHHRDLIVNTAEVLKILGKPDEAAVLYEAYLERNPADSEMRRALDSVTEASRATVQIESGQAAEEPSPDSVLLNNKGEQAYLDGDLAAAERYFNDAYAMNPEDTEVCNNLAVLHWNAGNPEKTLTYLAEALERDPGNRDLVVNGGKILGSLGQVSEARALCAAYLHSNADDTDVAQLLSAIDDNARQQTPTPDLTETRNTTASPVKRIQPSTKTSAQETQANPDRCSTDSATGIKKHFSGENSAGGGGGITIATSIAPKGLAKQKRAIQSWLEFGFEVISLNTRKELELLQPQFPGVRFVPAPRNGSKLAGKPYVFVDDIMAALHSADHQVVGIINSDIELRAKPRLVNYLTEAAADSVICGSRIDIENAQSHSGRVYTRGFDFFFFSKRLIEQLPKTKFMLGVPWWDYWLPCAAIEQGIPVKRIDTPLGYHLWHEVNYNTGHMVRFAEEFVSLCKDRQFATLYQQCLGTKFENGRLAVLADGALDYLARHSERLYLEESVSGNGNHKQGPSGAPKITAIISTYNSESHIAECLSDLVNQTVADQIEIVIIDADSPQNERAVVERFQDEFANIRYYRTATRIGIYAAWNMAVELARGEYIITVSTNDRLRLDACEILARTLDERADVSLVYGNSFLTKVPHESFEKATLCGLYRWPAFNFQQLLDHCMVGPHPMWRRSVHQDIGYFNEEFVALGDQDFWLRLGERFRLMNVPDFTGVYYVSESSISGDADLTQTEADRIHSHYGWRYRYGKWFAERKEPGMVSADPGYGSVTQIVVLAMQYSEDRLANTLESIANQSSQNWRLTVLSDRASPDALFGEEPRLAWVQCRETGSLTKILDQLVEQAHSSDWLCLVNAGDRLEPGYLSVLHCYLAKYPQWKLVYTDHDLADANGDLSAPCFKPDWNLELLRSTAYIGHSLLVSRTALLECGGFGVHERALQYDLVLRTYDQFGGDAIGHIAEILIHHDAEHVKSKPEASLSQQRHSLEQHLQRCGLTALIRVGVSPGTFMLDYHTQSMPSVSILIEAAGSMERLSSCLQSVLTRTQYPNFEVCVLVDSDLQAYVREHLEKQTDPDSRWKLMSFECASQEVAGDYLAWMTEDTVVLQPNWLQRLVKHGVHQDVGIVGARIVDGNKRFVDGGIMLGTGDNGIGARCHAGMHMTSPGYMGRGQVAQEVSAVSALCMLVSKAVFEEVGGYDPRLRVPLYRAIDFCQRVRRRGKRIVWTPYSTLMYRGDPDELDGKEDGEDVSGDEADVMVRRWLPQLADDPAYNRNLSRDRSDMALEIDVIRGWDPQLDMKLRTIGFGVGSYGSWQYRVKQPLDAMDREGVAMRTHAPFCGKQKVRLPSPAEIEMLQPHSLLMHNTLHDDYIAAMERYKRLNKAFIIFGQDDLMTALPPKNPFSASVYKDMKKRIRKCLSLADRLLVTTEPLADALQGMADDIRVVPNYLDSAVWGALSTQRGVSSKPRVGWAGAQQHLGDLQLLEEVLRVTADEIDWVFFGMCPDFLLAYVKEVHKPVLFADYPAKLATLNLDLAVAPLERNKFNEAKSNLRLLEYGALGWSVIASDLEPYRHAPVTRVPNQPRAWINAIRARINDLDTTWKEGDSLRDWVRDHWMLQQHLNAWLLTLDPVAECGRQTTPRGRAAGR